jgi:fumarylacetoacetase
MDETHDPKLKSFIEVPADCDFPIQNLPYCVFRRRDENRPPRVGVAIGEQVLDLAAVESFGHFKGTELAGKKVFSQTTLNAFMALGRAAWSEARLTLSRLLREDPQGDQSLRYDSVLLERGLVPMEEAEFFVPVQIGDYTDFYSSRYHAENVGVMFRGKENALMPNWLHLPVGYHGRSSSIVVDGTDFPRPHGQTMKDGDPRPTYGPSRLMDFELETGFIIGAPTKLGERISVANADHHIFGMVLVNDWSARDIQKWEYQPLGPFLGKNFCTSISPFVVTMDALEPFRIANQTQDPTPLEYLRDPGPSSYDINLEAWLQYDEHQDPVLITKSNFKHMYWTMRQQLAHHTINGCPVNPGDLMGSGTISGPDPESRGCMLERTWKGTEPFELPNGQTRKFLEDGDRLTLRGWCDNGSYRVGFGQVSGRVLPAVE